MQRRACASPSYVNGNRTTVKRAVRVCNAHGSLKLWPKGGNSLQGHRGHGDKAGKKPKTALVFSY